VYANAPYLDPDTATTTATAAATSTRGTNSAESAARLSDQSVPTSHPTAVVSKRVSGGGTRQNTSGKRLSMYHQTSAPPSGLESPEAHASAAAVGDVIKDPGGGGPASEQPAAGMEKAAVGRGGGAATTTTSVVPVHRRPSSGVVDMSRQMAKRTEAFEQLSALLQ